MCLGLILKGFDLWVRQKFERNITKYCKKMGIFQNDVD